MNMVIMIMTTFNQIPIISQALNMCLALCYKSYLPQFALFMDSTCEIKPTSNNIIIAMKSPLLLFNRENCQQVQMNPVITESISKVGLQKTVQ